MITTTQNIISLKEIYKAQQNIKDVFLKIQCGYIQNSREFYTVQITF